MRNYNAEYYDAFTTQTDDIAFYKRYISPTTIALELGCGTGRVSIALAKELAEIVGVDLSTTMLAKAIEKVAAANSLNNISFAKGDITELTLHRSFDFIFAPFRVMQCLEKQEEVEKLFETIHKHLLPTAVIINYLMNSAIPYVCVISIPKNF